MKSVEEILKKKVLIVAEIGNNHEGNFQIAKKLINEAKKCGVDAVKFQTFIPEHFIYKKDKKRIKQLNKFKLTFAQYEKLSKYAKKKKLIFFSTPFDLKSAFFLNKIQSVFKISSSDNNFYPLLKTVAKFNKTMIISTGLLNFSEILHTKKYIENIWKTNTKNKKKLIFLHCVSSYPVEVSEANLLSIPYLKKKLTNNIVGYSDHSIGIDACIGSVFLGAKVIEKHFTLSNNFSKFRDHKHSLNPKNMKLLVTKIRLAEKYMGRFEKKISKNENRNLKFLRRSIAVNKDISKGNKLCYSDLIWVRNNYGLKPGSEKKVLKKYNRNLIKGDLVF